MKEKGRQMMCFKKKNDGNGMVPIGSVSPNLLLVLYHNPDKFLSKLIKTIRVHSVHYNYKASASSSEINSSGTIFQGSL